MKSSLKKECQKNLQKIREIRLTIGAWATHCLYRLNMSQRIRVTQSFISIRGGLVREFNI